MVSEMELALPGIVSAHLPNEPASMAAQTQNLASEYLGNTIDLPAGLVALRNHDPNSRRIRHWTKS